MPISGHAHQSLGGTFAAHKENHTGISDISAVRMVCGLVMASDHQHLGLSKNEDVAHQIGGKCAVRSPHLRRAE